MHILRDRVARLEARVINYQPTTLDYLEEGAPHLNLAHPRLLRKVGVFRLAGVLRMVVGLRRLLLRRARQVPPPGPHLPQVCPAVPTAEAKEQRGGPPGSGPSSPDRGALGMLGDHVSEVGDPYHLG